MASSAHKHLPTAAPPPTPSTQPNRLSSSDAADALSHLLHRHPPSLSLPSRLSPPTTSPPLIPFSSTNTTFLAHHHLSSVSPLGYFQLTNHPISSQLARSAESDALSLFNLPRDQKHSLFSKSWPLGYEDEDDEDAPGESFCLDETSCTTESTHGLRDFALELEKVGLHLVQGLSTALGLDKPDSEPFRSLMWISEGLIGNKPVFSGRFYPYILSLQYQVRCRKYSLMADSGWVSVSPQVDSVLVTIGDIAQVWSNGKLNKVRGRPLAISGDNEDSRCITMSLLVTLPTDTGVSISPLVPVVDQDDDESGDTAKKKEEKKFSTFSFEDYAWRVYHERFLFKDPLYRYRI